jgi:hypothetical protein
MKKLISFSLSLMLLQSSFLLTLSPISIAAQTQEIINNESIIKLVKSEVSEAVIISVIKNSKSSFNTSPEEIMNLKSLGISDNVILEMVQAASRQENPTDAESKPTANNITLLDGTPVKMRIGRTVSSKDAKIGETVDFEVLEDIKIGEKIVIARGAVALATVTNAKPKGRLGKGGKLDINIDSVRLVNGEKIALRAVKQTKGGGKTGVMTGAIVASSILFFPAAPFFLFMKGKDISIPKGTEITGYINGDIPIDSNKLVTAAN